MASSVRRQNNAPIAAPIDPAPLEDGAPAAPANEDLLDQRVAALAATQAERLKRSREYSQQLIDLEKNGQNAPANVAKEAYQFAKENKETLVWAGKELWNLYKGANKSAENPEAPAGENQT